MLGLRPNHVDQRALLIPLTPARELRTFRDSLVTLEKILGGPLFPAAATKHALSLANVTGYDPTCGLSKRPKMLLHATMQDLLIQIPFGRPQVGLPPLPAIPKRDAIIRFAVMPNEKPADSAALFNNFRSEIANRRA